MSDLKKLKIQGKLHKCTLRHVQKAFLLMCLQICAVAHLKGLSFLLLPKYKLDNLSSNRITISILLTPDSPKFRIFSLFLLFMNIISIIAMLLFYAYLDDKLSFCMLHILENVKNVCPMHNFRRWNIFLKLKLDFYIVIF